MTKVSPPLKVNCSDCGACCQEMCSPPFMPEHLGGTELAKLPAEVRASFDRGMILRAYFDWPEDEECFWLDGDLKCEHYKHRPEICREFEVGSEACLNWRDRVLVDEL